MEIAKMRVKNKYFSITPDVAEKMKEADINSSILRQRLAKGWAFEDAIEAPIGVRRSEWDSLKPKENDIASYKERMEQRRLQELKRKKPHLFNVPQKHSRSEWCTYLMENDIFPRKVVRS
ncbi:SA1788 family PVL leukocidin-associated protein [Staphylococcus epidermidis]|uniref:SA1788 family PVL leukocidin-associated protein n=1 Tax=Staphylococcus epidermidis TaxID=1282 RepID=UPI002903C936|nr:SA1788 family PVL leukocidin-associated protein [Staphylococcus epidermidis]MDU0487888.1 SA1788 family PVL leukocidin-associated protein [Staphylococcus epidermidis]